MNAKTKNDDTFKMRIASDELEKLHQIAGKRRTSAAAVLRELVRREHAKLVASGLLALFLAGCEATTTDHDAPDAAPLEYESASSEQSDEGAFVIAEARCNVGDELVEHRCSPEDSPHFHPAIPVEGLGAGWRCGDYGSASVSIKCAAR